MKAHHGNRSSSLPDRSRRVKHKRRELALHLLSHSTKVFNESPFSFEASDQTFFAAYDRLLLAMISVFNSIWCFLRMGSVPLRFTCRLASKKWFCNVDSDWLGVALSRSSSQTYSPSEKTFWNRLSSLSSRVHRVKCKRRELVLHLFLGLTAVLNESPFSFAMSDQEASTSWELLWSSNFRNDARLKDSVLDPSCEFNSTDFPATLMENRSFWLN